MTNSNDINNRENWTHLKWSDNPMVMWARQERYNREEEMYYTVECNECGERITGNLLASDFNRPGLMNGAESYQRLLEVHNLTHYVKPTIYNCEDDDVFGVLHTECNHQ